MSTIYLLDEICQVYEDDSGAMQYSSMIHD